jgi:hypothetical protein
VSSTPIEDPYLDAISLDSPWGYWPLDDEAGSFRDLSGNNRPINNISGFPQYRHEGPTPETKGVYWQLSDTREHYGRTTADCRSDHATITAWFKFDQLPSTLTALVSSASAYGGGQSEKILWVSPDGKVHWATYGVSWEEIVSPNPIDVGVWYFVTASIGPAGMKLHLGSVDGGFSQEGIIPGRTNSENVRACYVMLHGSSSTSSRGDFTNSDYVRMARVAFWKNQLSDSRLVEHYLAGVYSEPFGSKTPGWWDGSTIQPVELLGVWDGETIQMK